jgi:macrolide transport system ATP-binding/permease protein
MCVCPVYKGQPNMPTPDWKSLLRERAPAAEASLIDELAQHLEDRYRELMSAGASEQEAYEQTVSEVSDMAALRVRMPKHDPVPLASAAAGNFLEDLGRDLRYAARTMRKNPLFVLFVVATLALGIGANTTVFSVINTLILNPLPVPDSAGLFAFSGSESKATAKSAAPLPLSYLNLRDFQARNNVFHSLAGYTSTGVLTLESGGASQRMFGEFVTANYFPTLGLEPARGRFFLPDEDSKPGAYPVAVMNYATWQARFGGANDIVGKTLRLNNVVFTVVGVAPPRFIGVSAVFGPDLWIPASMIERSLPGEMANALSDRGKAAFQGIARLKPGVTRAQGQANATAIASGLEREYSEVNAGHTVRLEPVSDVLLSNNGSSGFGRTPILLLLAVAGIVLLIACSNVANLLLSRSAARQQEIAIRLAVGASRERLLRQLLTESVFLALLSGVVGAGAGYFGTLLLWSFRPAEVSSNLIAPNLNGTVFLFAFVISLVAGFLFGAVPALRASRAAMAETLKEESRSTGRGRRRVTFSNALLVGQVAFSFLALVMAALFLRSIDRAYQIDPGFETKRLAVFLTNPGQAGYAKPQIEAFYKDVRERVSALPGVATASWSANLPLWGRLASGLKIEGRAQRSKADVITTVMNTVDVNYFETARVPILGGRGFNARDRVDSTPVAVVNQKAAHDYWPNQNPLGKRIQLPGETSLRQIVGIARTTNYSSLGEPAQPCVYVPLEQNFSDSMTLYVRSKGDPRTILFSVQQAVHAVAPRVSVDDARTGSKIMDQGLFGAKIAVALLAVFGLLALGLASIGLYGIMAYSVTRRRREIGLRMALGAAQSSVLRLILKQGMSLVLTGVVIGLVAALLIGRLLTRLLFGIGASDPASVASAAAVLLLVALFACYLPARSASRVDPLVALHEA